MATKFADTLTALIRSRPQGITAQAIVVITARPRGTVASALRTLRIAGLIHRVGTVPSTRGGAPKVLYGVEPSLRARAFRTPSGPAPLAAIPPARPVPAAEAPTVKALAFLEAEGTALDEALAALDFERALVTARLALVGPAIAALKALSPEAPATKPEVRACWVGYNLEVSQDADDLIGTAAGTHWTYWPPAKVAAVAEGYSAGEVDARAELLTHAKASGDWDHVTHWPSAEGAGQ